MSFDNQLILLTLGNDDKNPGDKGTPGSSEDKGTPDKGTPGSSEDKGTPGGSEDKDTTPPQGEISWNPVLKRLQT